MPASQVWEAMSAIDKQQSRAALLRYNALGTMSMIRLLERLSEVSPRPTPS